MKTRTITLPAANARNDRYLAMALVGDVTVTGPGIKPFWLAHGDSARFRVRKRWWLFGRQVWRRV